MTDKVYVLTPVYNGEKFLRETMESVQAQTWSNLEHIVIDNASTDGTPEILAEYADAKVPVRVIRNEKLLPVVPNWNTAVDALPDDAKWFRILCADDTMTPDYIEKCASLGNSDPSIGIVACKVDLQSEVHYSNWPTDQSVYEGSDALRRFLTHDGNVLAPHVLYRRDVIIPDQPFFDETVIAFDTDAVLRTYCSWKLGFVHEVLAMNRVHENSVTATTVEPKRLHLFDWYNCLHRYGEAGLGEQGHKRMHRRFRRHYLWRLFRACMEDGNLDVLREHNARLKKLDAAPTLTDALDVLSNRVLEQIGMRQRWVSYPW